MDTIATMLMAFATFVLAIVAVFQDRIHDWLRRPKLTVSIASDGPREDRLLKVSNEEGKGPAFDVEAVALSLTRLKGDVQAPPEKELPANLRWAAETKRERTLPFLHRGMFWRCKVLHGHVIPSPREEGHRIRWHLEVMLDGRGSMRPGEYVLTVRVAARNHKAFDTLFRVTCTNKLFPTVQDAERDGCTLEPM